MLGQEYAVSDYLCDAYFLGTRSRGEMEQSTSSRFTRVRCTKLSERANQGVR